MAPKKAYSRLFIILQEKERGFGTTSDKNPSGYVKVEVKNNRCKISHYIQDLNPGNNEYRLILISNENKENLDIGKLILDEKGKSENTIEFNYKNIADSNREANDISGAAIVRNKDDKLISILQGFNGEEIKEWDTFKLIKSKIRSESEEKKENEKNVFKDYEDDIERVIENSLEKEEKENIEKIISDVDIERKNKNKNDKNHKNDKCHKEDKDHEKDKCHKEDKDHEKDKCHKEDKDHEKDKCHKEDKDHEKDKCHKEDKDHEKDKCHKEDKDHEKDKCHKEDNDHENDKCKKNDKNKGNDNNKNCNCKNKKNESNKRDKYEEFIESIMEQFDSYELSGMENTKWYIVPVRGIHDFHDQTNQYVHQVIFKPMMSYFPQIKAKGHFLVGYRYDKKGDMAYLSYGLPGEAGVMPYYGRTGFVTYVSANDMENGYWVMYYDFRNNKIIIPIK